MRGLEICEMLHRPNVNPLAGVVSQKGEGYGQLLADTLYQQIWTIWLLSV